MIQMLFWTGFFIIFYAYIGYPILILILASLWAQKTQKKDDYFPSVSVIICAFNEEKDIKEKIENTIDLRYPSTAKQIIVVADGCTDKTEEICGGYAGRITLLSAPKRNGKVDAMNRGVGAAIGEVILFTDANTFLEPDALVGLIKYFSDPVVGGVSGAKNVLSHKEGKAGGAGMYWKYETFLKKCDSAFYSAVGAPGEFFAVRKSLYEDPGKDSLIEDFILSVRIVIKGYRVIYAPELVATEIGVIDDADEFTRRRRITCGGVQAVVKLRELWNIARYPKLSFIYISHRVLRWVVTPFLFPIVFICSALLSLKAASHFYVFIFYCQILFYGLGFFGWKTKSANKIVAACFEICLLNVSALAGFYRYCAKTQPILWEKAKR